MEITKHAQSCFLVSTGKKQILIDPGKYVFTKEKLKPGDFTNIDIIIITHIHSDHFDYENLKNILKQSSPIVLSTKEIIGIIVKDFPGLELIVIGQGYKNSFSGTNIEGFESKHGKIIGNDTVVDVIGVTIREKDTVFYHPGDTVELDPKTEADIIAIPFNGEVTMDIPQAKEQLLKLKPQIVIPMHYESERFPSDPKKFAKAMENTGVEVEILQNGERLEIK